MAKIIFVLSLCVIIYIVTCGVYGLFGIRGIVGEIALFALYISGCYFEIEDTEEEINSTHKLQ